MKYRNSYIVTSILTIATSVVALTSCTSSEDKCFKDGVVYMAIPSTTIHTTPNCEILCKLVESHEERSYIVQELPCNTTLLCPKCCSADFSKKNEEWNKKYAENQKNEKRRENVTDICGNEYETFIIGDQIWIASNMNCNKYDTESPLYGKEIPLYNDSTSKNAPAFLQTNEYESKYSYRLTDEQYGQMGLLYNWFAIQCINEENAQAFYKNVINFFSENEFMSYEEFIIGIHNPQSAYNLYNYLAKHIENFSDEMPYDLYCTRLGISSCTPSGKKVNNHVMLFTIQGICPNGFHVPTVEEWQTLLSTVYSFSNLKSSSGWGDSFDDKYYFNLLPCGYGWTDNNVIHVSEIGENASFWTSSIYNYDSAYRIGDREPHFAKRDKNTFRSVRCVKNRDSHKKQ